MNLQVSLNTFIWLAVWVYISYLLNLIVLLSFHNFCADDSFILVLSFCGLLMY